MKVQLHLRKYEILVHSLTKNHLVDTINLDITIKGGWTYGPRQIHEKVFS